MTPSASRASASPDPTIPTAGGSGGGAALIGGLIVLVLAGPGPLRGQAGPGPSETREAPVRVTGSLGAYTLQGGDFQDIGAGPGLGAGLRARLSPGVSLGAGVAHSWHAADRLASSFRVLSLHLEPRLQLSPPGVLGAVRPFLGLRAGYARWTAREASESLEADVSAGGLQAAGLVGVAAPMGDEIHLELVAEAGYLAFGDARVDARVEGGDPVSTGSVPGTDTDGILLGLRAALSAPIPWP